MYQGSQRGREPYHWRCVNIPTGDEVASTGEDPEASPIHAAQKRRKEEKGHLEVQARCVQSKEANGDMPTCISLVTSLDRGILDYIHLAEELVGQDVVGC